MTAHMLAVHVHQASRDLLKRMARGTWHGTPSRCRKEVTDALAKREKSFTQDLSSLTKARPKPLAALVVRQVVRQAVLDPIPRMAVVVWLRLNFKDG